MLHGWIPSCMHISSKIQVKPLHPSFSHGPQCPPYTCRSHCSPVPHAGASLSSCPILGWETCRNLTPVRWLALCHTWPKLQFGRGQTHKHVDKTSLIPGGTEALGSGDCVVAQPFPHVLSHLHSPAVEGFGRR